MVRCKDGIIGVEENGSEDRTLYISEKGKRNYATTEEKTTLRSSWMNMRMRSDVKDFPGPDNSEVWMSYLHAANIFEDHIW